MPHLAVPRKGWENERLAAFLLSQIAFVAHPMSVADDVGSDFFCTIFEPTEQNGTQLLFPLNSFAVQINSSRKDMDVTNKINYLRRLELPFFLGVIHRSDLSLCLYSGEYLPMMFSKCGRPHRLKLSPTNDVRLAHRKPFACSDGSRCTLNLPLVGKIVVGDTGDTLSRNRSGLRRLCSRMHSNISTWKLDEYVFRLSSHRAVQIMAGSRSAKTFRHNFYLRLAEVFYNLEWLLRNQSSDFNPDEFKMYERMYKDMIKSRSDLPNVVSKMYEHLKELVQKA